MKLKAIFEFDCCFDCPFYQPLDWRCGENGPKVTPSVAMETVSHRCPHREEVEDDQ
jgi:hypothetical protein